MIESKLRKMEKEDGFSDQSFDFPDEILLEILAKLPFKSVFRFRCVSKNWFSLISNASFFPWLVSRSKDSPPFALVFQCQNHIGIHCFVSAGNVLKNHFTSPFTLDQIRGLKVRATSHDLILYESNDDESLYVVANPFTRQCVRIPTHDRRKRSYDHMGLIRNGITSYNVVRVVKDHEKTIISDATNPCLNLEIFSSEKGEWRDLKPINCISKVEFDARPCIAFKGIVHWICNKMRTLLAYDSCSDQCRFISIPNEAYYMHGRNAILGFSCDKLYYFEMSRISIQGCNLPGWKLWVLEDYEKGDWRLDRKANETRIDALFGVLSNVLSSYSPLFPLAFHPWKKDTVYFWYEGYVLTFNLNKGWFEDGFTTFSSLNTMVSTWEIFPLLMPLCPTQILDQLQK